MVTSGEFLSTESAGFFVVDGREREMAMTEGSGGACFGGATDIPQAPITFWRLRHAARKMGIRPGIKIIH